ncbi:nSTAND1 domain-containing NTPase [Mastigocladopsis repens]|uniref:nSTAND1 domain-containing NTPase n=1 Tax=Mastigocladopsis repens TaxID=221287 RepID=UPI000311C94F|nr:CHAT domain-containing protein [Mastigocladopsis repens]
MSNTHVKTILILAANPTNSSRLRLDEEVREIDEGLRRANKREQFKLEQKWAVRQRDFYRAMLDCQPQIVHFCGHGAGQDGIVLDDETGQPALISADPLGSMFKLFATKGVDCVLLNACYSEVQAAAISQHVNYVIGMTQTVGDKAAVAFAVAFYDAIAAGEEVEFAYELGCSQMFGFLAQQIPVLRKKQSIIPTAPQIEVIPPNPYQGLSAFGEEDAAFFFGREMFVNSLVQAVHKQPLIAVIGPSGSGKSSVVYAGLIPQLRAEGSWLIESFRPGNQPFYQLASALVSQLEPELGEIRQLREAAGLATDMQQGKVTLQQVVSRITERNPDKRLLLVADQFEELYTLCQVKEEQERFVNTLLEAIHLKSLTLVFTLRADFYGYVLSYRPFRDALQEFTPQLVSSMSREELQAAIALPAQKLEVQLEDGLTQRILDDVGLEPGNLPLLEFALTRVWEKQQNRVLTHQAYDEIGGVKKALANHAEQIYRQLGEGEKKQAQRIFLQLVRPGEGTEDTRRLATRAEVGNQNWGLVSYLAGYQARLVVTGRDDNSGEDTVEVVHEALIREWITLREWMNANRQFRVWQERLKVAIREWQNNNHDSGALLRGVSLTVAEEWLQKRSDEMTQEERDFIQASASQRDREKLERDRRRQRTMIGLSSFSAVALILAGVAGVGWWRAAIREITSLTTTSDVLLNSDGVKALKESLKAVVKMQHTPLVDADTRTQVELTLLNTVDNVTAPNTLGRHAKAVIGVTFSPDGKILASASADKTVKLWDTATGQVIQTLSGHTASVWGVSFSPDGKILASASRDKTVKLWDPATGKEIKTLSGHIDVVNGVSFSPDGKILASTSADKTVKLWDTATGQVIQTLSGHIDAVSGTSFSPDGKILASASRDKMVKLWDTATGKEIKTLSGHIDVVNGVSFSPDGKILASTSADKTVKLWDTATGQVIQTLNRHKKTVNGVSFSPNGKMLASTSTDNNVKLWDTATGQVIQTLSGHTETVNGTSFSPDGKILATASFDKTVKLWDTATGKEIKTLSGHTNEVRGVSFSPDGKILASASFDKTVKLWNSSTSQVIKNLGHTNEVFNVSFSPDGKILATASYNNTVKLWDSDTGQVIKTLSGHTDAVNRVSFSPDGKILASASRDQTVKLWDSDTGQVIKTLSGHTNWVNDTSFSPDGKTLASASRDQTVKLWDSDTGQVIKTLSGHTNWVNDTSFSPNGKILASASRDQTVKLWDTAKGQVIKTLSEHTDQVYGTSFSLDGKILASASADKTVKLWDTPKGKEIKTLSGYTDTVYGVSFSPNGKMLATASYDNTVRLWRWDYDNLLREGCAFMGEYFKTNPDDADTEIGKMCDERVPNQ